MYRRTLPASASCNMAFTRPAFGSSRIQASSAQESTTILSSGVVAGEFVGMFLGQFLGQTGAGPHHTPHCSPVGLMACHAPHNEGFSLDINGQFRPRLEAELTPNL